MINLLSRIDQATAGRWPVRISSQSFSLAMYGSAVALLMLLSACAGMGQRPVDAAAQALWDSRQQQLAKLKYWELQGRMALRTADSGLQASVRWQRQQLRHIFDLSGPFGRGHVRLSQDQSGASLINGEQQSYHAATARELLYDTTGWDVPLDNMNFWVLGLPVPKIEAQSSLDPEGRLLLLKQGGWQVRYLRYKTYGPYVLPSKLSITQDRAADSAMGADTMMELRLVIGQWDLRGE